MPGLQRVSNRTLVLVLLLACLSVAGTVFYQDIWAAYQLIRVQEAFRRRDWQATVALLNAIPDPPARAAEWNFLRARAERRSGRNQNAADALDRASALGWNRNDISREKILLQAQSGNFQEVENQLEALSIAGAADEQAEEIYEASARGLMMSLRFVEAMRCLNFWAEWQVDNPLPPFWLGELQLRLENPQAAAIAFEQVLKRSPEHLEARLKLAEVRLSQQQVEAALTLYEQCAKQATDCGPAFLGMAECKRRQGQTEEASQLLYEALTLDLSMDQQSTALGGLGQIALENMDYSRAKSLIQQALDLNSHDPGLHLALAAALLPLGEQELAGRHRATAKAISDRHGRLIGITRRAIQEPENAELRYQAGLILLEQGLSLNGAQWLESAIRLQPDHGPAHLALARYLRSNGNLKGALEHERLAARAKVESPAEPRGGLKP